METQVENVPVGATAGSTLRAALLGSSASPQSNHADGRSEQLRDRFGLLSPDDLSALIGADPRTLAIWRATQKGPDFTKAGRAVYYRRADIEAWLALNVVPMDRVS